MSHTSCLSSHWLTHLRFSRCHDIFYFYHHHQYPEQLYHHVCCSVFTQKNNPLSVSQDAEQLLSMYKAVMCSILEDSRLVQLQQEGGASLSRLRREESCISMMEEYQAEVEAVSHLYDQVDELLHRLVTLSNSRTQELNFIQDFRSLEDGFSEVSLSELSKHTHL